MHQKQTMGPLNLNSGQKTPSLLGWPGYPMAPSSYYWMISFMYLVIPEPRRCGVREEKSRQALRFGETNPPMRGEEGEEAVRLFDLENHQRKQTSSMRDAGEESVRILRFAKHHQRSKPRRCEVRQEKNPSGFFDWRTSSEKAEPRRCEVRQEKNPSGFFDLPNFIRE